MNLPRTSRARSLIRCAVPCALLAAAGCSVVPPAQEDATRYYVLAVPGLAASGAQGGIRIGLSGVSLGGYLKRREMVVRTGPNEVEFRDYRRWAEPLDEAIARIVQSSLLASPGVSQVWVAPFPTDLDRDFDVSIAVTRCEGAASRSGKYVAAMAASIEVSTSGANARVVARRLFVAPDEPWDGEDYGRLAGLLSGDAAALGREVLAAIPPKS